MHTDLVGQYVVDGWDRKLYHKIVAVTVDREQMILWARNVEGRINKWNAEGVITVKYPPLFEEEGKIQTKLSDETICSYRPKYRKELDAISQKIKETVAS